VATVLNGHALESLIGRRPFLLPGPFLLGFLDFFRLGIWTGVGFGISFQNFVVVFAGRMAMGTGAFGPKRDGADSGPFADRTAASLAATPDAWVNVLAAKGGESLAGRSVDQCEFRSLDPFQNSGERPGEFQLASLLSVSSLPRSL
jgi:hypothetical protein